MLNDNYNQADNGHFSDEYTADEFNRNFCLDDTSKFLILHQNIRSFNANYDYLAAFLDSLRCRPSIMVLSETWHSSSDCQEIDTYTSYHVLRDNRTGGGVSVFVDNRWSCTLVDNYSYCCDDIEVCTVTIKFHRDFIVYIVGIYRPPHGNMGNFHRILFDEILSGIDSHNPVFVCGDFNVDIMHPNLLALDLEHEFSSLTYIPVIRGITRPSAGGGTCIDHLWTNQVIPVVSGIFREPITDHFPIFALVSMPTSLNDNVIKQFRDHSAASLADLRREVILMFEYLGDIFDSDVDSSVQCVVDIFYDLYNKHCPLRKKSVSQKRLSKPWMNNELLLNVNRKHSLFRSYKRGETDFEAYRTFKNILKRRINHAKNCYYQYKFMSNDYKTMWNTINSLNNGQTKKKCSGPPLDAFDGVAIHNDMDLSMHFNDYFSTIGSNLSGSIAGNRDDALNYMDDGGLASFFVRPSSAEEVSRIISSFPSRSCSPGSVPSFIYKYLRHEISPLISDLFNLSIDEGSFPACLKVARVTPVFKSGDKSLVSNYRPISVISTLSKIFEKLMFNRLIEFLDKNNILKSNQFGFRKHHCTSDAVLEFLNDAYKSLDEKSQFLTVCLDLSKAFDTVDHWVLLRKLAHVGVRGLPLQWFGSYLRDRKQYVRIRSIDSELRSLSAGVPQGSVLGPLLFLIYINEMSNACPDLKCIHYADDTTIYVSDCNARSLVTRLNTGLSNLCSWLANNKLVLNVAKTNCMVISNSLSSADFPSVMIDDTVVNKVNSVKFLGVYIDSKLSFRLHVDMVCGKVARSVGVVRRVSPYVPSHVLIKLYYGLIYPHLTYGILAWGNSSMFNVGRVEKLLARFRRILYDRGRLNCSGLMCFRYVFQYFALVKLVKSYKLGRHIYFSDFMAGLVPKHTYGTRFSVSDNLNLPAVRLSSSRRAFLPVAITAWNSLPPEIRWQGSLYNFKRSLQEYFKLLS